MYPGTVPMGNCTRPVIQNPGTLHADKSPVCGRAAGALHADFLHCKLKLTYILYNEEITYELRSASRRQSKFRVQQTPTKYWAGRAVQKSYYE